MENLQLFTSLPPLFQQLLFDSPQPEQVLVEMTLERLQLWCGWSVVKWGVVRWGVVMCSWSVVRCGVVWL